MRSRAVSRRAAGSAGRQRAEELIRAAGPSSVVPSATDQGEPRAVLAPFSLEVRESSAG
ncbi:MAG: hypothetical protein ACRCYR_18610 [Phycicoccus sp.]